MNQNTGRIMRWIETQGVVVYNDPKEKDRLLEYILPVAATFPEVVNRLSAIYVFRMQDQRGDAAGADGISWRHESDTGTFFAIGISTDAMDEGEEYCRFVFLHELAHLVTWEEHGGAFHEQLNEMLDTYNRETGSNIPNDFLEWPSRYDRRGHGLLDGPRML